jgi:hypothetical protein
VRDTKLTVDGSVRAATLSPDSKPIERRTDTRPASTDTVPLQSVRVVGAVTAPGAAASLGRGR